MRQLEELEKKVAQVIHRNKSLFKEISELKKENKQLKEQNSQLQASLMKESTSASSLAQEKDAMKNTISELLATLNSLESAE
jgi:FtsZ-binding cell division protein ZapB